MKKTSLAEAKTHLSELVDAAEYRRKRTIIFRRGRAVAAIVPVTSLEPRCFSADEIELLFAELGRAEPSRSAVAELVSERR